MIAVATSKNNAEFRRELLPPPLDYFAQFAAPLTGKGLQRGGACHIHGGSDSLGFRSDTGAWLCRSCGAKGGDIVDHYMQVHGVGFLEAARALGAMQVSGMPARGMSRPAAPAPAPRIEPTETTSLYAFALELLNESKPLAGSTVQAYLQARGCRLPPADADLRFHPSAKHITGYRGACMLGRITHAMTGAQMGVHRTFVAADGSKPVTPAKMTLGPKQGGVIRLWPDEAVTYALAIAEGIETALTMAHDYTPVWSLIDAGNMAAFPVLAGIETLVIGADHDPAGLRAAHECADRWAAAGVDVRVIVPETLGADWNDVGAAS